jgi:hypothetical protein
MHKFGVVTALALSWAIASCAARVVNSVGIPQLPPPKTAPKPQPNNVEERRRAEMIAEKARKRPAIRSRHDTPSARVKPEQSLQHHADLRHGPRPPTEFPIKHEPSAGVVRPSLTEPIEPNVPVATLMPPPPEPAEPTFPSTSPIELPSQEPPTSILSEVPSEAALPPPPTPAEPSFPVALLMPPPPEPAEPSLPSQEQIAAASPISIPFPDLSSYLSLRPRFDWVDTVGAIDLPHPPMPEALETNPEEQLPDLVRKPWPLPLDGS